MAVFTTLLLDLTPLLIDIRFYEDRGKYKQKKKKKTHIINIMLIIHCYHT